MAIARRYVFGESQNSDVFHIPVGSCLSSLSLNSLSQDTVVFCYASLSKVH